MTIASQYQRRALTRDDALGFLDRAMRFVEALEDHGICFNHIDETPAGLVHDLAAHVAGYRQDRRQ